MADKSGSVRIPRNTAETARKTMNKAKILIVDDNPGMVQLMGRLLAPLGETRFAMNGAAALKAMAQSLPDMVLLDAEMPGMDGFEVCKLIKTDPDFRDVPVIMVTGHSDPDFELAGFRAGVADFIAKPVREQLVLARVTSHLRLKYANDELRRISKVDPVTKLSNRDHFEEMIDREWRRCLRSGQPLAVAMFEIDHFDLLVDRHGRRAGDDCVHEVARALLDIGTRPGDVTARYDQQVFAMLLPVTPRRGAEGVVQRVMAAVEARDIPNAASPVSRHVTLSAGIGCYDEQSPEWLGATGTSAFIPDAQMARHPQHLRHSAMLALEAACRSGRSQAWWLDVAHTESPGRACEVLAVA